MSRQSLNSDWIRIGRGSLRKTTLILLAVSAGIALFIIAPMSGFGPMLTGRSLPIIVPYLASVIVVFLMIAPLMLPRATRPLYVDRATTRLRVGLRTMPIDELRHAYRLADPLTDGRFQLKLAVRGLDALVGISPKLPAELSQTELDALLAIIERAPIEPDPAVLLRPPLGSELGQRTDAERFDDALTTTLMPYELTTFAKQTLLLELRSVRGAIEGWDAEELEALKRDIGLVAPFTTNAPERQAALAGDPTLGPQRGFWATQSSTYRAGRNAVETWLRPRGFAPKNPWQWWLGLLLVVGGLLSPLIAFSVIAVNLFVLFNPDFTEGLGTVIFFIFTWPFITAAGFMLMWHGRIVRYERARQGVIDARRSGVDVQASVADFFGPPYPEVAFASRNALHLLVQFLVLLVGGLTLLVVIREAGFTIGVPIGILMVLSSAAVFTAAVRRMGTAPVRALRARAFWDAIRA